MATTVALLGRPNGFIQLIPRRRVGHSRRPEFQSGTVAKWTHRDALHSLSACTRQLRRAARWGDYRQPGAQRRNQQSDLDSGAFDGCASTEKTRSLSQRQSTPSAAWRRPRRGWEEPNSRTQRPKARIHGTSDDAKADPSVRREQEDRDEALEIYLLERVLGLREHYAAQHSAFSQLEDDAYARHPDPTPDDVAAAEAAEAALPSRKRTEAQLRRSFAPLAVHLPSEIKRKRKRFV